MGRLEIMLFLVDRPGELISADWVHFFSSFRELVFPVFSLCFTYRNKKYLKKKKKNPGSRLAIILGTWCRVPTLVLKVLKGLKLIFKKLRP